MKIKTLIIGAGPAGLAAAMELSKGGEDFVILEKDSQVGGLSKTYKFIEGDDIFLTDNGPHRFFSKNPYLYNFIEDLLNEKWITVRRHTRQFIGGKFYDYPVNAFQAFRNLGIIRSTRIFLDYILAKIIFTVKPVRNFSDYVYSNFGWTLGKLNMINYTEKIWGIPAEQIHIDWASQRIKGLNVSSLLKNALLKSKNGPKTLIDTFYYPESGTGLIYETIKTKLLNNGYSIYLNTYPVKILHDNKRIIKVICNDGKEFEFENLVESVPLKHFIDLMEPSVPQDIKIAQSKLKYRSQVYLFLTINKPSVTIDQWIYFPEKDIPFGRISEMKNFSQAMSPRDKTSLFIEFFCTKGDRIWSMSDTELFDYTMPHLKQFVQVSEVRKYYVFKVEDVYPIYDVDYVEYLGIIKKFLNNFENLYYIGRPGRFKYNNQDHSLEMGILAAKSIIDGTKYDIETVGSEKEYYESGRLKK